MIVCSLIRPKSNSSFYAYIIYLYKRRSVSSICLCFTNWCIIVHIYGLLVWYFNITLNCIKLDIDFEHLYQFCFLLYMFVFGCPAALIILMYFSLGEFWYLFALNILIYLSNFWVHIGIHQKCTLIRHRKVAPRKVRVDHGASTR